MRALLPVALGIEQYYMGQTTIVGDDYIIYDDDNDNKLEVMSVPLRSGRAAHCGTTVAPTSESNSYGQSVEASRGDLFLEIGLVG